MFIVYGAGVERYVMHFTLIAPSVNGATFFYVLRGSPGPRSAVATTLGH
jgi:hypothetical protein